MLGIVLGVEWNWDGQSRGQGRCDLSSFMVIPNFTEQFLCVPDIVPGARMWCLNEIGLKTPLQRLYILVERNRQEHDNKYQQEEYYRLSGKKCNGDKYRREGR